MTDSPNLAPAIAEGSATPALLSTAVLIVGFAAFGCAEPTDEDDEFAVASWEANAGDRAIVATVGGEPIYSDCVADHGARGMTRDDALAECIDFELLAQEARRRGLENDWARETLKTEATRRFIDETFYATFSSKEDIPVKDARLLWERGQRQFYNREENRSTVYCRAANPDTANPDRRLAKLTPEGEPSRKARRVAEAVYAKLRGRKGLTFDDLKEACDQASEEIGGAFVTTKKYTALRSNSNKEYGDAAFSIAEVGTVSPAVRTQWGWDVILMTFLFPAAKHTFEEALPDLQRRMFDKDNYELYRRGVFSRFLAAKTKDSHVERFDEVLGSDALVPPSDKPKTKRANRR